MFPCIFIHVELFCKKDEVHFLYKLYIKKHNVLRLRLTVEQCIIGCYVVSVSFIIVYMRLSLRVSGLMEH